MTAPAPDSLLVRPATITDAPAIANLSAQLGYPVSVAEMTERLRRLDDSPDRVVLVACSDERVVAWIEVVISRHLHSGDYALISGLVVDARVRGRGVGSRLCAEAENWARRQGQRVIRLRSQIAREDAHRFYLREGYRQTKTSAAFEKKLE